MKTFDEWNATEGNLVECDAEAESAWNACAKQYRAKIRKALKVLDEYCFTETMDNEGIQILRELAK